MRIVSWNINSLRLRLPLLEKLIELAEPDVICLQETKVPDPLFPIQDIKVLGYPYVAYKGMKSYNGVCILSKHPFQISPSTRDWCGLNDCRHIAIDMKFAGKPLAIHNFYVPAGGDEPDPKLNSKFKHKLDFLAEATDWFKENLNKNSILVGDLNIAPLEHDVWSHKQLLKIVSHTPVETEGLTAWLNTGFVDAMRKVVPENEKLYTWWSYRNKDWEKSNRGRRLDHLWITPQLLPYLETINIYKEVRNWEKPSDHVPISLTLKEKP